MTTPRLRNDVRAFMLRTPLSTIASPDVSALYVDLFQRFSVEHPGAEFSAFHEALGAIGYAPAPASYTLKRKRV